MSAEQIEAAARRVVEVLQDEGLITVRHPAVAELVAALDGA